MMFFSVIRIANCQDFCDRAMMTDGDEYNDSLKEHQITNGKGLIPGYLIKFLDSFPLVFEKGFIAPELSVIDEIGESRHEILMNSCMNVNCNIGDLHCHS